MCPDFCDGSFLSSLLQRWHAGTQSLHICIYMWGTIGALLQGVSDAAVANLVYMDQGLA